MKIRFNKSTKFIFLFAIVIIIMGFLILPCDDQRTYISYKEFVRNVDLGIVENVEILEKKLYFKNKNDDTKYYTDNPETNNFKEYLLLNDTKIIDSFGEDEVISILDYLFYAIFFATAGFGIYKLVSLNNKDFKVIKKNNTNFSNVVGLENIKKDMLKTVDILKNIEEYKQKGIRPPKGIILEGPPGNGKTLFARALAGEANINYIATKGADFQSAMMSIGPRKIKNLFNKARKNKPCIVFIDEFDGIGERRNYAGTGVDKENNRIITAMLNEMDGFSNEDGVLVIAATNSYASLDAALIRPGRFDRKYKIDNPNQNMVVNLIDMYTKNKPLSNSVNKQTLAKCFENLSCSAIETVLNEAAMEAEINNKTEIGIDEIVAAGIKTNTVNIKIK